MILINRQVNNHYSMGGTHFLQTGYLLLNRNAPCLILGIKKDRSLFDFRDKKRPLTLYAHGAGQRSDFPYLLVNLGMRN